MFRSPHIAPSVLLLSALTLGALADAQERSDWPRLRGANLDGAAPMPVSLPKTFGLEPAWKKPIGEGYSAISVVGDVGVTMCSGGEHDVVVAFDAATGETKWRYKLGPTYKAHSGSDGGPVNTPAIHDGKVYGFGRHGEVFVLRLTDGSRIWQRKLDGKTDAYTPQYGFCTSPLVTGGVVVIQTGGPKTHSITAFDEKTGEPRWRVGDDKVNYQSPGLMTIDGAEHILAINDRMLFAIVPATGKVLWEYEHTARPRDGIALPHVLDGGRILINSTGDVTMLRLTSKDGRHAVKRLWRSRGLGRSYALPVHHKGYLYGYNSRFMTCVDATNGKVKWRSRPPGGEGLMLVGDYLAVLSPKGDLVLAEATPEGYREKTRVNVLDKSNFTAPVFAGGRFFVRNKTHMAAVRITGSATALAVAPRARERQLLGEFGAFVRRAEASDDKLTLIYRYFAGRDRFPIVEADGTTHFIYRGKVDDIALTGNFLAFRDEVPLDRVAGTDVYFASMKLDPAACYEYRFDIDFGKPITDPKNPLTGTSMMMPVSILRMPKFDAPKYLAKLDDEKAAGRMDSFQFQSESLKNERRVRLYVPAAYSARDARTKRFPLLVVMQGGDALEAGAAQNMLDNLIHAKKMAPVLALFVEEIRGEFDQKAADFIAMLGKELLPQVTRHYRVSEQRADRAIIGTFDGATMALYAAVEWKAQFGKVASQTAYLNAPVLGDKVLARMKDHKEPTDLYVEVRKDDFHFGDLIDSRKDSEKLIAAADGTGFRVIRTEVPGSWGWSSWQASWDEILGRFFPPAGQQP